MDKKELQRILQQKFNQSSAQHTSDELTGILKERVGEWLQEISDSEETFTQIQQKLADNIQGFCATYLYNSVEKKTFELKQGAHYQTMHEQLQELSEAIKKQNSPNQVQEVLRNITK